MSQPEMMPPLGVDRISALPDQTLIHILSFLPTKSAFATTVLSKRWRPLFHSLTTFYFDDEAVQDKEAHLRFRSFVDTLLSPRHQHQPIKTFFLVSRSEICVRLPQLNVDKWVEAAKHRGVENLELSTSRMIMPLSSSFFTSRTLVVLKLSRFYMGALDFVSVDLPSLKTLHLIDTYFRQREDFMKLLSGCPNLVDLYTPVHFLNDRYNDNTGYKTLPKLEKACIRALDAPFTVIDNVQFLRIVQMERMKSGTILRVFRNLISIEICFDNFSVWDGVLEVLSYCPKLQHLAIERPAYKGLYKDGVLVELPYCPMLQTLIEKQYDYQQFHKEKWAEMVPECVSSHLTTCSIRNYRGWDDDFKFAEFILQNASFIQTMKLHSAPSRKEEKQWVFKHLSWCPRIPPACKIFLNAEEVNQQEHEKLIVAP